MSELPAHEAGDARTSSAREVYVARQPVCDRDRKVVGYELLFREPLAQVVFDAARATSSVIVDALTEIGLEALVGDRQAHINVSRTFLIEVNPLPLSPDRFVLEVSCEQMIDDRLLQTLRRLTTMGFAIALDDFSYHPELDPLMEVARIAKVNVLTHDPDELARQAEVIRARGLMGVAERVETHEEYERAKELGFERFQGFFLERPRIVSGRGLPARSTTALRSISHLQTTQAGFEELEEIISNDVGLSYKLLRFVNSAFFGLPREVASIRQAITLLGERMVRRWTLMMMLASGDDVPSELLSIALARARMCELLAPESDRERFFTVGLFSVVDALLDAPMEEVVEQLPFDAETKGALLSREGPAGAVLARVIAYERGDFASSESEPGGTSVVAAYREAVEFSDAATQQLG